jgi:HD-GYP domain-containing protein (c-di-GMP phosphodiesterase class II)
MESFWGVLKNEQIHSGNITERLLGLWEHDGRMVNAMREKNHSTSDADELRRRATEQLKERQKIEAGVPEPTEEAKRLIQELQIHQIELEMQNEELQKSRAAAEALLNQYTDLYDFAPAGYFSFDREGTIRRMNLSGVTLLGRERAYLVNHRFGQFVSEADRPAFNDFLQKVFTKRDAVSGKPSCELTLSEPQDRIPLRGTAGSRDAAEATRRYVYMEGMITKDGEECRAVMTDITERKRAEAALQEIHSKLERNLKGAIEVISETIERKGPYAPGHHRRTAALASAIAREMRLTDIRVQGIELAAAVYDIGLMTVPIEFLQDNERLDGIKLTLYQGYPRAGHDTLMKIEFPWPIAEIILQHRELFDGSGFPRKIKGEAIYIEARILAVAVSLEDLMRHRSYRNGTPLHEALESISSDSGSKYDPEVVAACLRLFKEKGYKIEG